MKTYLLPPRIVVPAWAEVIDPPGFQPAPPGRLLGIVGEILVQRPHEGPDECSRLAEALGEVRAFAARFQVPVAQEIVETRGGFFHLSAREGDWWVGCYPERFTRRLRRNEAADQAAAVRGLISLNAVAAKRIEPDQVRWHLDEVDSGAAAAEAAGRLRGEVRACEHLLQIMPAAPVACSALDGKGEPFVLVEVDTYCKSCGEHFLPAPGRTLPHRDGEPALLQLFPQGRERPLDVARAAMEQHLAYNAGPAHAGRSEAQQAAIVADFFEESGLTLDEAEREEVRAFGLAWMRREPAGIERLPRVIRRFVEEKEAEGNELI